MSTTFEVHPTTVYIPSIQDIIALATKNIEQFYRFYELPQSRKLSFEFQDINHTVLDATEDSPLINSEESSLWFYYEELNGGTDAHFRQVDDLDIDCWNNEILTRKQSQKRAAEIKQSLEMGHYWIFRRSAGQSAEINLAYGYLASSLAELTNGLIYSNDSAWDYECFPCSSAEFNSFYFKPEMTNAINYKEWSSQCIESIRKRVS